MNYPRIALAAVAAWIVYFLVGGAVFGKLIAGYYRPYPGVYRAADAVMSRFPIGIVGMLIAILVLTFIYAKGYEGGSGLMEGLRFGLLVGLFTVGAVVGGRICDAEHWRETRIGDGGRPALRVDRRGHDDRPRLQAGCTLNGGFAKRMPARGTASLPHTGTRASPMTTGSRASRAE